MAADSDAFVTEQIETATQQIAQVQNAPAMPAPQRQEAIAAETKKVDALAERYPDSPTVQNAAARTSLQLGDTKSGIARAEHAIAMALARHDTRALVPALLTQAIGYGTEGDYPRAYGAAKEALDMDPKGPFAKAAHDIVLLSQGRAVRSETGKAPAAVDPAEASKLRDFFTESSPLNDPRVIVAGRRATSHVEAIKLLNGSMAQLKVNDAQGALDTLQKALEHDPAIPDIYMQRAIAWTALHKLSEAIAELGKAIALWTAQKHPDTKSLAAAYNMRSMLTYESKDFANALSDASAALKVNPASAQGHFNLARAQEATGEKAAVILDGYKRAAELDPSQFGADYEQALGRFEGGGAARGGRPPVAPGFPAQTAAGAVLALLAAVGLGAVMTRRKKSRPSVPAPEPATEESRVVGGHFRLIRVVGSGGMGQVYEGWDLNLERRVGIKRLREELEEDPEEWKRFLAEAKTVAAMKHPHIVDIHEVFEEGGSLYIVFEFMEGETLQERVKRSGRLNPAQALEFLKPIAEALDHAHERGVIHRDLKPANIMLENGAVKIMDFGIARRTQSPDRLTKTSKVFGTPAYMPPEQRWGEVSKEADLYALGVCSYELLSGRLPFERPADEAAGNIPAVGLPRQEQSLGAFFKRALSPERANRFHSGSELFEALKRALA